VYRGEETYSAVMYYTASATYTGTAASVSGEAVENESTYTIVATYEGDVPEEVDVIADNPTDNSLGLGENANEGVQDPGSEASVDSGTAFGESFRLPFWLDAVSPIGAAMLGAIVAAGLALLVMGYYNKRVIRENSQA
jgi:hypothetical protein